MTSALTSFQFEDKAEIRTATDADGKPLFIGADLCRALGYANTSKAIADHVDPEDKVYLDDRGGITSSYTPGSTLAVNESGLYALIFGSTKPEAKRFKKWITSEVLPAIRKTGAYSLEKLSPARALLQAVQQLVDHEERITAIEARQTAMENGAEYFTVLAYARLHSVTLTLPQAQGLGQRAANLSNKCGLPIGRVRDPRFGEVNTYHTSVLEQVFAQQSALLKG